MEAQAAAAPVEFLCPISLEVMRDPVIASSGVTYDRASIHRWLSSSNSSSNAVCPVSLQRLDPARPLVPNFALRSLIQSWRQSHPGCCAPTSPPRSPITKQWALLELSQAKNSSSSSSSIAALKRLRAAAIESVRNARVIVESGAADTLACILEEQQEQQRWNAVDRPPLTGEPLTVAEEAVGLLALLPPGDGFRRRLLSPRLLQRLGHVLRCGSPAGRVAAATLAASLADANRGAQIALGAPPAVIITGLVAALTVRDRPTLVLSALRALLAICQPYRNRAAAARCGAVAALVELLPASPDGDVAEAVLTLLEMVVSGEEGAADARRHALAVPALAKKLLRVSDEAGERAVAVLWAILCCDAAAGARSAAERARGLGLLGKLTLLLRRDLSPSTRHKVVDILDKVYNVKMDYDSPS